MQVLSWEQGTNRESPLSTRMNKGDCRFLSRKPMIPLTKHFRENLLVAMVADET
jgi:hypothetical protein